MTKTSENNLFKLFKLINIYIFLRFKKYTNENKNHYR